MLRNQNSLKAGYSFGLDGDIFIYIHQTQYLTYQIIDLPDKAFAFKYSANT